MVDFELHPSGRIVRDNSLVDVYYQNPVPIFNFTKVDIILDPTSSSGNIILSTYPEGIDIFNSSLGMTINYDLSNSGINKFNFVTDTDLKRTWIPISGTTIAGRR